MSLEIGGNSQNSSFEEQMKASMGDSPVPKGPSGSVSQEEAQANFKSNQLLGAVKQLMNFSPDTKFNLKETEDGLNISASHGVDNGSEGKVSGTINLSLKAAGNMLSQLKESLVGAPKSLEELTKMLVPFVTAKFGGDEQAVIDTARLKSAADNIFKNLPTMSDIATALEGVNVTKESVLGFIKNMAQGLQAKAK